MPVDSSNAAKATQTFDAGIIEAFRLGCGGFSADRIVADDALNAAFAEECRRLGLAGTATDWNRALLRLRKSGKLSPFSTKQRTEYNWVDADRSLFASEIALSRMEEQGHALDDVLCHPELRQEFDEIARSFAPGFTAFEYRWGAFRIRKAARDSLAKAAKLADFTLPPEQDLFAVPLDELRRVAGLYLIGNKKNDEGPGSALYAGVTLDLERRLRLLLEGCRLRGSWQAVAPAGRLFVRILALDAPQANNWISELSPYQARVVAKFAPLLNFKVVARA